MVNSQNSEVAKTSWMLEKAQHAAKASGVGPEAVARILQKTKEQAETNSEEHQEKMRLLAKKMNELRAEHEMSPFKDVEPPVPAADVIAVIPKVIKRAQKGVKRKLPPAQGARPEDLGVKKAKVQKRPQAKEDGASSNKGKEDAIKQNKAKAQKKQQEKEDIPKKGREDLDEQINVQELWEMKKQREPVKDEPTIAVFAESSTAGASRERMPATATIAAPANNADTDIVASNKLFVSEDRTDKYPVAKSLPSWYTSITLKSPAMEAMSKRRPPALTSLDALKTCITKCEETKSAAQLEKLYDTLRDHVHKAEIELEVNMTLLRKANMLSPDYGLPRIFKQGTDFPWDLKADAFQLYTRWYKCDLNQNILRGIVPNKTDNRTSDRLDEKYRKNFPTTPKYYGEGDLVLGQWWPTQLCLVRDGAHGSAQGGIYGERDRGAYSIVLSGGHTYHDIDNGDTIEYSGTEGKNFTPTENTLHLLKSATLLNPIRVIRSAQLSKKNKFRPQLGFRYDGLYVVRGYTMVDQEKAMYRFRLERIEGQDPIRWEGKASRPTVFEIGVYHWLKDKGFSV